MKILKTSDAHFQKSFHQIICRAQVLASEVELTVKGILAEVKENGDRALKKLTQQFDGHKNIKVSPKKIVTASKAVNKNILDALQLAYARIEDFHRRQLQNSWFHTESGGEILGQLVRPLERVGVYVPGGKAVYPSSVLMNVIPAKVAGVQEIVMMCPGPPEGIDPVILAAAHLCGVTEVFQVGGAQAVAALAYGTQSVPRVDKIVGPGNIFVATAKKFVFGDVDIDMIAGPSEILIISDGSGSAAWVAADMLSQAEHDEMASSILITTDEKFGRKVAREVKAQLAGLPKKKIAAASIENYGAVIIAADLAEAVRMSNDVAPEHLELFVREPWNILPQIKNAGAIFMGHHSPEPLGDYLAGPNHVLPTGGTARFFSPLSVDDFIKKISLLSFTPQSLGSVADEVICLARSEKLEAHARSVEKRVKLKDM